MIFLLYVSFLQWGYLRRPLTPHHQVGAVQLFLGTVDSPLQAEAMRAFLVRGDTCCRTLIWGSSPLRSSGLLQEISEVILCLGKVVLARFTRVGSMISLPPPKPGMDPSLRLRSWTPKACRAFKNGRYIHIFRLKLIITSLALAFDVLIISKYLRIDIVLLFICSC